MPILIHKFIQINLIILSILTSKFNIFLFKFELGKIIGTIRNEITTNNIKYVEEMFYGCHSLIYLNISQFNTLKLLYANDTFKGVDKNITLIFDDKITNDIFRNSMENLSIINSISDITMFDLD